MLRFVIFFILAFSLNKCEVILEKYATPVGPAPCDATYSIYKKENHYFERDFITEEGSLDQRKWWFNALRPEKKPCIADLEKPANIKKNKK